MNEDADGVKGGGRKQSRLITHLYVVHLGQE